MSRKEALIEFFRIKHFPSTTDIFFDRKSAGFIPPDSDVLVVGPGIQILRNIAFPMDRAPIVLAPYLKQEGGSITIFDAPNNSSYSAHGEHNLELVKRYFDYLNKVVATCDIQYVYGDLMQGNLGILQAEQFDVVHDHLTTDRWILMFDKSEEVISKKVDWLVNIYKNLLRTGGKAFVHYCQERGHNHRNTYVANFENAGFAVTDIFPLNDKYSLPDQLKNEFLKSKLLSFRKELYPYYKSDGVLIAQKK